jgi:hypothetical protein
VRQINELLLALSVGVAATLLLCVIGVLLSGGGHDYTAIILFFPFVMLFGSISSPPSWLFLPILFCQFPLYIIIYRARFMKPFGVMRLIILIAAHTVAIIICFMFGGR